jgi:hypothetical protein
LDGVVIETLVSEVKSMPRGFECFAEIFQRNPTGTKKSMNIANLRVAVWVVIPAIAILGSFFAFPTLAAAQAQNPGNKTVWNANVPPATAPSVAWIDASAYWDATMANAPDLCGIISINILNSSYATNYPNGAVIDARGLYNPDPSSTTTTKIACTGSPFDGLPDNASPPPTTILLPAGNIPISSTWVLPNNTKISGVGGHSDVSASTAASGNTVLSATSSFMGTDMIDMGSSSRCGPPGFGCSGVAVEHVFLDASAPGLSVNGIVNNWSQSESYVNDVVLNSVGLTGLVIGAGNSGPYSNIKFAAGSLPTECTGGVGTCPVCVYIGAQTRGLHGVTCIGTPGVNGQGNSNNHFNPGHSAIYVNASNNTIEDVHIEAFWDGVEIGDVPSPSSVSNIVLSNIFGGYDGSSGWVTNTVHICGRNFSSTQFGACSITTGAVSDVAILQATDFNAPNMAPTTSVQDDTTGTSIGCTGSCPIEPTSLAGMYVLGDPVGGGFSLFSTSPAATGTVTGTTWGAGSSTSGINGPCTTPGALYSNTSGGVNMSVYVCTYSSGSLQWLPIA